MSSNSKYKKVKCGTCKKTKALSLMYGEMSNGTWICNACISKPLEVKEKKKGRRS